MAKRKGLPSMRITNLSVQQHNSNRVNVFVDGKYTFSLDVLQVVSLGVKVGREYDEQELMKLEQESQFSKLYSRALEYCLMRPHSAKEIKDYLWRKTRATRYRSKKTGEMKERPGVSQLLADRVYDRLLEKAYIDDEAFARYWVENRNQTKGMSRRKLEAELRAKGVTNNIIEHNLRDSSRNDNDEIQKIITKKRRRYPDDQKLMQYLVRQGFSFDDVKAALSQ